MTSDLRGILAAGVVYDYIQSWSLNKFFRNINVSSCLKSFSSGLTVTTFSEAMSNPQVALLLKHSLLDVSGVSILL